MTLTIEAFDSKGNGRARFGENEVRVPFALPGETVEAFITWSKKKGVLHGELKHIATPSSKRIEKACPHFGRCGGCTFQMLSYEDQIAFKNNAIQNLFPKAKPVITAPQAFSYRNKMEYSFSENREGKKFLGLYISGKKGKVETLENCLISPAWFSLALEATMNFWEKTALKAYFPPKDKGTLRSLTLREGACTGDRMAFLTVSGNPEFAPSKKDLDLWCEAIKKTCQPDEGNLSLFVIVQQLSKGEATRFFQLHLLGPDHIREKFFLKYGEEEKELLFQISPLAFFQPNSKQANLIYQTALNMCPFDQGGVVWDLYCGTATLGAAFSFKAEKVEGIELSPEAVCDARENLKLNGISNMNVYQGDVGKLLPELKTSPDLIIIDPPRSGLMPKVLEILVESGARYILYISCNPLTQKSDSDVFLEKGFEIIEVQPIDQFPQTPHLENIVLFASRRSPE